MGRNPEPRADGQAFDPAEFARLVRVTMAERNVSYRDVEAEAGVDHATLNRVCKRERPPSVETYLRLMAWIGGHASTPTR